MAIRTLRGGTWNMLRDRKPEVAAREAIDLMDAHRLDFLCIQECSKYRAAIRQAAGDRYRLIEFHFEDGRGESAIIVRASVRHGHGWQMRATRSGWVTVRGGTTPPKYLTTVFVDGWLRVVSGHTAPSVKWRAGRILGPARRVLSMRQFMRSVVKFARRHGRGPLLIACDWNATPSARGPWSPKWACRKAGLSFAAPTRGTHGNRVIDYALVRNCDVTAVREDHHGSDHRAVIFTVRSHA